jgi:hypothetical protein
MGRAVVGTTDPTSGVTAFFDKIQGLPDVTWTGVCISTKLVAVTVLSWHVHLR